MNRLIDFDLLKRSLYKVPATAMCLHTDLWQLLNSTFTIEDEDSLCAVMHISSILLPNYLLPMKLTSFPGQTESFFRLLTILS